MSVVVTLDYDVKKRCGIIRSDIFADVREHFSVKSPKFGAAKFNRFIPDRKYVITPTGRFKLGLYWEIIKHVQSTYPSVSIEFTDAFKSGVLIGYTDKVVVDRGLRDYQSEIVTKALKMGTGTIVLATAGGKAQPLYSKIQTPNGWTTMRDVRVGELVSTPDGGTAKIVQLFPQGKKKVYRITFDDGRYTECCGDHLWKVHSHTRYAGWKDNWNVVTTDELINLSFHKTNKRKDGGMAVQIPLISGDAVPTKKFDIDPYVIGVLIGDGCCTSNTTFISSKEGEIIDKVRKLLPGKYELRQRSKYDFSINLRSLKKRESFIHFLKNNGLHGCHSYNKFIPEVYLRGSFEQRLELLRGILDTDGTVGTRGAVTFSTTSKRLANDVIQLVRSIGGIAKIRRVYTPTYTYKNKKRLGRTAYTVSIIHSTPDILFSLSRKKKRASGVSRELRLRIMSIEDTGRYEECQCIAIDSSDHLYVTDDFIVTHNTFTMASLILSVDAPKTLVIVPDPGLVEQTYNDFLKYGVPAIEMSRWTGAHELFSEAKIIIANRSILQSENSDIEWIKNVDLLIVDEVQGLKKGNGITEIVSKILTPHKYGFTGTLPENDIDRWTIMGITGPMIYQRKAHELREENYVAQSKALILKVNYKSPPLPTRSSNPAERYHEEVEWLAKQPFRNKLITKLCGNFKNNALLLVDRLEHGETLKQVLSEAYPDRHVYFINGEMEVEEREKIKQLMEKETNVLCVAMSKIFAVGISINNLHYIVFCNGGKSRVRVIQSIGRGLRLHKDKHFLTIVDIADQLKYGVSHSEKRKLLYLEEKIPFTETTVQET